MIGSVCVSVCLCVRVSVCVCACVSVCCPHFSDMERPREVVLGTLVGYGSETEPIDFGVIQCIFKVKGDKKPYFSMSVALKTYE